MQTPRVSQQDDLKATGSDGTGLTGMTGLTGAKTGLTGMTGLTGAKTGLTGASSESRNSSKAKNWIRPSFKEVLAKYEKMGATQKQRRRPNEAKDEKASSSISR